LFAEACKAGDVNECKTLMKRDGKFACLKGISPIMLVNMEEKSTGSRPIHAAAAGGNLSMVKFLVGNGAVISKADDLNETPLHKSVANGDRGLKVTKYLLDSKKTKAAKLELMSAMSIDNATPFMMLNDCDEEKTKTEKYLEQFLPPKEMMLVEARIELAKKKVVQKQKEEEAFQVLEAQAKKAEEKADKGLQMLIIAEQGLPDPLMLKIKAKKQWNAAIVLQKYFRMFQVRALLCETREEATEEWSEDEEDDSDVPEKSEPQPMMRASNYGINGRWKIVAASAERKEAKTETKKAVKITSVQGVSQANEKFWHSQVDRSTNETYYYNAKTGHTMWEKPPGYKPKTAAGRRREAARRTLKKGLTPDEAIQHTRRKKKLSRGVEKAIEDGNTKNAALKEEVRSLETLLKLAEEGKEITRPQSDLMAKHSPTKGLASPPGMTLLLEAAPPGESKAKRNPSDVVQKMVRAIQVYQHLASRRVDRGWYYMDQEDETYGPFPTAQIKVWLKNGEFDTDQLVRYGGSGPFMPLVDLYPLLSTNVFEIASVGDLKGAKAALQDRLSEAANDDFSDESY